ncbi:unnamed protein product, partial [marine sediment metagenome]
AVSYVKVINISKFFDDLISNNIIFNNPNGMPDTIGRRGI